MTKFEELYHKIAAGIPDTTESKMFGALCIKAANGKAGAMFWHEDMIFKLDAEQQVEALKIKGAQVFTPSETRPPMNGWIHIPNTHAAKWKKLAETAMAQVKLIEANPKIKVSKPSPVAGKRAK